MCFSVEGLRVEGGVVGVLSIITRGGSKDNFAFCVCIDQNPGLLYTNVSMLVIWILPVGDREYCPCVNEV